MSGFLSLCAWISAWEPFSSVLKWLHHIYQWPHRGTSQYRCCFTWMTLMLRPVSWASCSRMCLVGLGVAANAAFSVSSCLALIVVRGPRRFPPRFWSSFSLFTVSLSDRAAISVSFRTTSSWSWSWESGDKLGSLHAVTAQTTHEGQERWQ